MPDPVEVPIDGVLDLHLFQPREVADLVHHYLQQCREQGIFEVRIIHGKGTGALRRTVHNLLEREEQVCAYHMAPAGAGDWGATMVRLVRQ